MDKVMLLEQFGLSHKEAELYITLLELGAATSSDLIKRTGYYSKTTYEILNKLIKQGLASYVIKSNIKYFAATNPERFIGIVNEEKIRLQNKEDNIKKILPDLKSLRATSKESQEAQIYVGKKGMKSVFEEALKEEKEILVFGGGGKFQESLGPYAKLWNKLRSEKKIKLKLLWGEHLRKNQLQISNLRLIELKFLSKEFENPAPVMIFKDKVAITVWAQEPIAMLIRSKEVSKAFKNYFDQLWTIAKK
ncbi:MAG: TrmB family transcriptional regulator [Candidatus Woesearchaeota archaeon]